MPCSPLCRKWFLSIPNDTVINFQNLVDSAKPLLRKAIQISQQTPYWHCRLLFQLAVCITAIVCNTIRMVFHKAFLCAGSAACELRWECIHNNVNKIVVLTLRAGYCHSKFFCFSYCLDFVSKYQNVNSSDMSVPCSFSNFILLRKIWCQHVTC